MPKNPRPLTLAQRRHKHQMRYNKAIRLAKRAEAEAQVWRDVAATFRVLIDRLRTPETTDD